MSVRVVVGYDGSLPANHAIDVGAQLLPQAHGLIVHLWTAPFASDSVRQRLRAETASLNDLIAAIEREGAHEADRIAATGVTLARAAGWDAEPLVRRSLGGEGIHLAQIAGEVNADLVLIGARGLSGTRAVLGSVSDMVVHHATHPVLVVPGPLLVAEYAALAAGPVLVGVDGSAGSQTAVTAARRIFAGRDVVLVAVDGPNASDPSAVWPDGEIVTVNRDRRFGSTARAVGGALAGYARERDAAVVVVGSRGRSAVREILLGSVAMATLHHTHRPVMVVPGAS